MRRNRWAGWLLLIPFVALLAVPVYARSSPEIAGVPFFLWWTFLWAPLTALCTFLVYLLQRPAPGVRREEPRP